MKKTKVLLTTMVVLMAVGSMLAFAPKSSSRNTTFYKLDTNNDCKLSFRGTLDDINGTTISYNTSPTSGACPLSAKIKTPE